jgi:phosphate transport system permease protein
VPDQAIPAASPALTFRSRQRARQIENRAFHGALLALGALVLFPLVLIFFQVVVNGIGAINADFLSKQQKPFGETGGGIIQAIVGSGIIVGLATVISVPIGIAVGIYLAESKKGSRFGSVARTVIGVLQAVPSIIVGIVMYAWIVVPSRRFSALAGSIALALMMIPIVVNATEEVLRLIPVALKEGALALGAPHWRAMMGVILPAGIPGILGGVVLAISRVAGETAPLLFTAFGNPFLNGNVMQPTSAIPLAIYEYAKSPYRDWVQKAWGAAFILLVLVLGMNLSVRLLKDGLKR